MSPDTIRVLRNVHLLAKELIGKLGNWVGYHPRSTLDNMTYIFTTQSVLECLERVKHEDRGRSDPAATGGGSESASPS